MFKYTCTNKLKQKSAQKSQNVRRWIPLREVLNEMLVLSNGLNICLTTYEDFV